MTYYVPGAEEKDPAKVIRSLQQAHKNAADNTTSIATNTANIASNTTAITNLQTAGTGLVNSGGSLSVLLSKLTASLGADVTLNNTGTYFDGPSVAQGTTGTWMAFGIVTLIDTAGVAAFDCKLWDGTTVIASGRTVNFSAGAVVSLSLAGYLASPAGNIRISCKDLTSTSGAIKFNSTGNSKDSTVSVVRIA